MGHLLRAMTVSHSRVRFLASLRMLTSMTLAVAGLINVFTQALGIGATVAGALWALTYSMGLASWADRELHRAAVLQEAFEVRRFALPWNHILAGEQIAPEDVRHLSGEYHGSPEDLRDYYDMPDLTYPFDVLARQQQNLGWGCRVRQRYANAVLLTMLAWGAAGLFCSMVQASTITEFIVQWCVPSLGIFLLGWDTVRDQRAVARERHRIYSYARTRCLTLAAEKPQPSVDHELRLMARQVQDQLFLTRQRAPRVPSWFFQHYYERDNADFAAAMAELRRALFEAGLRPPPKPGTDKATAS
jgi:SMODS-associating 4TM effector domain